MILSVSQVERFDTTQPAGCPRAWWFERVRWLRPEQTTAQSEGEAGHALLAEYLATGALPGKRVKMGKMVTGAIVKGDLPKPGDDLIVEQRFDGSPRPPSGAPWPDLDVAETLHVGGEPWDGFIDLAFRRGPIPEIWDHKFFTPARPDVSSNPYAYLKRGADLINTVQMPVYVLSQLPYWPDAKQWRIVHHYVSKQGVDSQIRAAVVHLDEVLEQKERIEKVVEQIRITSKAETQNEVPFNHRACSAFSGCPHQSICSAFKEKNTVQLTPEEAALFNDFDAPAAAPATPAPAPVAQPEPVVDDEEAALAAQLAAVRAKKEAAAKAEKPAHRMPIHDVPAGDPAPVPQPTPVAPPWPVCACGTQTSAENASRLQDGAVKHVGCPLTKPATPPAAPPEPRTRKKAAAGQSASATAATQSAGHALEDANMSTALKTPAPATFAGERQSDRDATTALDAMAAPAVTSPTTPAPIPDSREHLAKMLESMASSLTHAAALIRSVG